jgi:hypothetical protein
LWFVQIIALKLNGSSFNLFEQHIIWLRHLAEI